MKSSEDGACILIVVSLTKHDHKATDNDQMENITWLPKNTNMIDTHRVEYISYSITYSQTRSNYYHKLINRVRYLILTNPLLTRLLSFFLITR